MDQTPTHPPAAFLTAEWRALAMLNYEVDPVVLRSFVPAGTELDLFEGRTLVSMVGFRFLNTRVAGWRIPFHTNFPEVNLRFYVRRIMPGEESPRRGTVFLREIVPRRMIAAVARWRYNEPYLACPMRERVMLDGEQPRAEYTWKFAHRWQTLGVRAAAGAAEETAAGSEEEFITEHYWGYNRQRSGETLEYQVEHPRWHVWHAAEHWFDCDVAALYGSAFAPSLSGTPRSAFLAEGSAVTVRAGRRLAASAS